MNPFEKYDPDKLRQERERRGFTREQISQMVKELLDKNPKGLLVKSGGLSSKTVSKIESGNATVGIEYLEVYAVVLGKPLDFFRRVIPDSRRVAELMRICLIAVVRGVEAAWAALLRPWEVPSPYTSPTKINPEDPTKPLDQSTSDAMWAVIKRFASKTSHFLHGGVIAIDEEKGIRMFPEGSRFARYIIQIDSSDDTTAFERFLGGTILVSVYEIGVGIVAAVACDFVRRLIFSRGITGNTQAIRLSSMDPNPDAAFGNDLIEPTGSTVPLALAQSRSLTGATLNVYLGKAYRVGLCAELAPKLTAMKDLNLVSYGGSRGAMLVAEGLIDASLEFTKGFKLLDSIPGLFLAKGAGAHVLNLDTKAPFDFGPDRKLEEIFTLPEERWADELDNYRIRFLVAATEELGREILSALSSSTTVRHKGLSE